MLSLTKSKSVGYNNKPIYKSISEFQFINNPTNNKEILGQGSFAQVKLARHKQSDKLYAIKCINMRNVVSSDEIEGVRTELEVHKSLEHPHLVKFYGSFKEDNLLYVVLEFAENGNLFNYLKKRRILTEQEAFVFFYQTALALNYMHKFNIMHRDLKPENLLLDKNNDIKVADFGWCAQGVTHQRTTFCGTYEYMAPEVVFAKPYDYTVDIWSLGILLYELLHGKSPFKAQTFEDIYKKFAYDPNYHVKPDISPDCKEMINRILKITPSERPSLSEILESPWCLRMFRETNYIEKLVSSQKEAHQSEHNEENGSMGPTIINLLKENWNKIKQFSFLSGGKKQTEKREVLSEKKYENAGIIRLNYSLLTKSEHRISQKKRPLDEDFLITNMVDTSEFDIRKFVMQCENHNKESPFSQTYQERHL